MFQQDKTLLQPITIRDQHVKEAGRALAEYIFILQLYLVAIALLRQAISVLKSMTDRDDYYLEISPWLLNDASLIPPFDNSYCFWAIE